MPGGTLGEKLAGGPLPFPECVAIIRRIASALDEAHRRDMVHRDIKPGNILFNSYGDAYLSDFGIVKWAQAATTLTGAGMIGTPAYMSPEQSEGRAEIGPAADVYALGVVLFQMVTGRLPFEAETPVGLALKHIRQAVPRLSQIQPSVPKGLQPVIDKAMAKRPEDRYSTAGQMASALESVPSRGRQVAADPGATALGDEKPARRRPTRPPGAPPPAQTVRAPQRRRMLLPIMVAAAGLGLIGTALVLVAGVLGLGLPPSAEVPTAAVASATTLPPTVTAAPSVTQEILPSATLGPAAITSADAARVGLLWSSEVTARNIRFPVRWSPAGDILAMPDRAQAGIALWDAGLGAPETILNPPPGFRGVGALAWSSDGARLLANLTDGENRGLIAWRVADGEVLLRVDGLPTPWCLPEWSPNTRYISCGAAVYDADTGVLLWSSPVEGAQSVFSTSSSLLAHGGVMGEIRVFDAVTGLPRLTLPAHQIAVMALSWSAQDTLASGAWDGEILGWPDLSLAVGSPGNHLAVETGGVFDLSWSPDGTMLLSAHQDHNARLWDGDLSLVREFENGGAVINVTWSPDGRRFATSALDGQVRVWGLTDP